MRFCCFTLHPLLVASLHLPVGRHVLLGQTNLPPQAGSNDKRLSFHLISFYYTNIKEEIHLKLSSNFKIQMSNECQSPQ
jgi:hypothetical protein